MLAALTQTNGPHRGAFFMLARSVPTRLKDKRMF